MQDMVDRIYANRGSAANYVSSVTLGTSTSESCSSPSTLAARDRCQWSDTLQGSAETRGGSNVGAMIGARGCIELVQASNPAVGVCTPGIYRVSVAWQGLYKTAPPPSGPSGPTCGANQYGTEAQRRVIFTQISIGLPTCSS